MIDREIKQTFLTLICILNAYLGCPYTSIRNYATLEVFDDCTLMLVEFQALLRWSKVKILVED